MRERKQSYVERWVIEYLRANANSPDKTVANIHAALAALGVLAPGREQSTRRALYRLERTGLARREWAGAVWLWEATDENDPPKRAVPDAPEDTGEAAEDTASSGSAQVILSVAQPEEENNV